MNNVIASFPVSDSGELAFIKDLEDTTLLIRFGTPHWVEVNLSKPKDNFVLLSLGEEPLMRIPEKFISKLRP